MGQITARGVTTNRWPSDVIRAEPDDLSLIYCVTRCGLHNEFGIILDSIYIYFYDCFRPLSHLGEIIKRINLYKKIYEKKLIGLHLASYMAVTRMCFQFAVSLLVIQWRMKCFDQRWSSLVGWEDQRHCFWLSES